MSNQLPTLFDALLSELNPAACLRDIAQFWSFRSTVPGPALRQASEFLAQRHRDNGLLVQIHAFPADRVTLTIDERTNPLAWTPRSATLEIIEPVDQAGLICSYAHEPLCLLSNSTATPPDGITAEVVVLHSGARPEDYSGLNVSGKIIFTDVWPLLADEQARLHSAVGLITDSVTPPWLHAYPPVRRPADVPDLTMWGVLNGNRKINSPGEELLWGFSLTPRQGDHLRRLILESKTPLRLRARVDADLQVGTSEVVDAVLPGNGSSSQEVWVLSHSSEPGALDNASGCCISLEIARLLKTLISSGVLPPPRRAIRFLNAVETEGYFPLVQALKQSGSLVQVVAALALDSVGSDFRQSGGSLRLFRSPAHNPTFADGLVEELIRAVAALPNERFTSDPYDLLPWQADAYFPNNDNFLAEGYFDIPTPMLCSWPDKHYHSNLDTVDKLSPNSLGRAGLIAAAYLYLAACAGPEDAAWIASLVQKDYKQRVLRMPTPDLALEGSDALDSLQRLIPASAPLIRDLRGELQEFTRREIDAASRLTRTHTVPAASELQPWEGNDFIPTPLRWQIKITGLTPRDEKKLASLREDHKQIDAVWNLLNGRRSAQAVAARLNLAPSALKSYLSILHNNAWIDRSDIQVQILSDSELNQPLRSEIDRMVRSVFQESYDSLIWADCDWYILVRVDGVLAAHLSITDRTVVAGENKVRVGGVGGVATLPDYRRQGLAALAMYRAAAFMRGPFNADFGLLLCNDSTMPYYAGLGWQSIPDLLYFDQPGKKIKDTDPSMFLPCRQTQWPSGPVDIAGYPW
jgi:GNAT superfamily N-acetyltransferase